MLQMKTAAASRGVVRSGTARVVPLLGARSARAWTAQRSFAVPSALGRLAFNQIPPLATPFRVAAPGVRSMSSLPPHMELAMPALSPTMTAGNIAKWMVKPGDKVSPGDHLCDVETDKATMGWEAQEEGYIAKILVEDGTNDVPVGDVVLVMCDEAADVAAFADFKPSPSAAAPAPAAPAPTATPAPTAAASPVATAVSAAAPAPAVNAKTLKVSDVVKGKQWNFSSEYGLADPACKYY